MNLGNVIEIVAAVIRDRAGRVLLVRKRGTQAFMQPGGKREPDEDDLAALGRELREELSCSLIRASATRLGEFEAEAANEPEHWVRAQVYAVEVEGAIVPQAEIEELAWVDADKLDDLTLAPLSRDGILPFIRARFSKVDPQKRVAIGRRSPVPRRGRRV